MRRPAIVSGYHSTTNDAGKRILATLLFLGSNNGYDWLGTGIYFWRDAPRRAWQWGQEEKLPWALGSATRVLGAEIRLEPSHCIDLLDIDWVQSLRDTYQALKTLYALGGRSLPQQRKGMHSLDHAVLDFLIESLSRDGREIHVVRGAFQEGEPIFANSALSTRSHVPIAIREEYQAAAIRYVWAEPP